jgi:hypothetical protein
MDNSRVTKLPAATREDQLVRWGLRPDGSTPDAGAESPVRADLGRAGIMGGHVENTRDEHDEGGRFTTFDATEREDALASDRAAELGFMRDGGWHVIHPVHGVGRTGMRGQHALLHELEYVDLVELARHAEARLGATVDVVRDAYGGRGVGPLPADLRPIREALDRELANVDNVAELARALGVPELERALRRGRDRGRRAL